MFDPVVDGLSVSVNGVTLPGKDGESIVRIHWNWGDGTDEDSWFPAEHTYSAGGTYTITVTSYQSDGLHTSKTVTATVSGVPKPDVEYISINATEETTDGKRRMLIKFSVSGGSPNYTIKIYSDIDGSRVTGYNKPAGTYEWGAWLTRNIMHTITITAEDTEGQKGSTVFKYTGP